MPEDKQQERLFFNGKQQLERHGSVQVKMLANAAIEAAIDGLGLEERDVLKKLDESLKEVRLQFLYDNDSLPAALRVYDDKNKEEYFVSMTWQREGMINANVLGKTFVNLAKDGLTAEDKKMIHKLDEILEHAKIIIDAGGNKATLSVENGSQFEVDANPKKPKTR